MILKNQRATTYTNLNQFKDIYRLSERNQRNEGEIRNNTNPESFL